MNISTHTHSQGGRQKKITEKNRVWEVWARSIMMIIVITRIEYRIRNKKSEIKICMGRWEKKRWKQGRTQSCAKRKQHFFPSHLTILCLLYCYVTHNIHINTGSRFSSHYSHKDTHEIPFILFIHTESHEKSHPKKNNRKGEEAKKSMNRESRWIIKRYKDVYGRDERKRNRMNI